MEKRQTDQGKERRETKEGAQRQIKHIHEINLCYALRGFCGGGNYA